MKIKNIVLSQYIHQLVACCLFTVGLLSTPSLQAQVDDYSVINGKINILAQTKPNQYEFSADKKYWVFINDDGKLMASNQTSGNQVAVEHNLAVRAFKISNDAKKIAFLDNSESVYILPIDTSCVFLCFAVS